MSSSQLVWQIVKNNNCFMHKGLNGVILSKEPGNLYNVHCYKYSGKRVFESILLKFLVKGSLDACSRLRCGLHFHSDPGLQQKQLCWGRHQQKQLLALSDSIFASVGISNDKAIHIEAEGNGLKVTKLITKHANKPSKAKSSSTRKKSFQRVSAGLTKELDGYRPDLKVCQLCRAYATQCAGVDHA